METPLVEQVKLMNSLIRPWHRLFSVVLEPLNDPFDFRIKEFPEYMVEFILGRAPIALATFSDDAKPAKGNARQHHLLSGHFQTMHGGRVDEDGAEVADVHANGDRTGTLFGARFPVGFFSANGAAVGSSSPDALPVCCAS